MASAAKSRWADTEEDAAFEAKRRKEKEEKKRLRAAEKARKAAAADEAVKNDTAAAAAHHGDEDGARPSKRQRVTPDRDDARQARDDRDDRNEQPRDTQPREGNLLRLTDCALAEPCRSVERYDKLNDIEEGAYGWVARAKDRATGEVVALKRLKLDAADRSGVPVTGLREIQLLKDCAHRNVVQLREVVVGDRRPIDK